MTTRIIQKYSQKARAAVLVSATLGILSGPAAAPSAAQSLQGTRPLAVEGDLAMQMVEGIKTYLLRETSESRRFRDRHWKPDYKSVDAYNRSVTPNRQRLRKMLGVADKRVAVTALAYGTSSPAATAAGRGANFKAFRVRWPVLEGMTAEGLLLEPKGKPRARIVAIPDADWSPEMFAGLAPGLPARAQFARRLAENGCQVLVPLLIDRSDTWSGNPKYRLTNQPHREYLYRMAFEVGRHVIGFEVQRVLAAVDWFEHENARTKLPIGVIGYGEGGMLALYSAALDPRIQAAAVSGYFEPRENLWTEPIYRDVWGLLREFGDAELASLVAPRALIIEAGAAPEVSGPSPPTEGRANAACPNGKISTPRLESVQEEVERARPPFARLKASEKLALVVSDSGRGLPGSAAAIEKLLASLGLRPRALRQDESPDQFPTEFDSSARLRRQFDEIIAFTQGLIERSAERRAEFWSKADASSPERWNQTSQFYRDYIWDEVIGRMPAPSTPSYPLNSGVS